jgi:hypothetical protein
LEAGIADISYPSPWQAAAALEAGRRARRRAADWLGGREAGEQVGVEVPFRVAWEGDGAPVRLKGVVDRLERGPDGELCVVDFKTGPRLPSRREVQGMEQLGAYQLAVECGGFGAGARSGGASLVFLCEADANDRPKQFVQAALSSAPHLDADDDGQPTWVHRRLSKAVAIVQTGVYPAVRGRACGGCAFASGCPALDEAEQGVGDD